MDNLAPHSFYTVACVDPPIVQFTSVGRKDSLANVRKAGVENQVEIREGNALQTNVSPASVVTLYLLPEVNLKLRPTLQQQLKPGSRIVSHDFDMGDWKPLKTVEVQGKNGRQHTLYLWKIEGNPK